MNEKKWRIYTVRGFYHVRKPGCWYFPERICWMHRECVAFRNLDRAFAHIKQFEEEP